MNTLRRRLILSHLLPLLIALPLIGTALVVALERQVLLPALAQELQNQGLVLGTVLGNDPAPLVNAQASALFLNQFAPTISSQIMLIGRDGTLLASAHMQDEPAIGQPLELASLRQALQGSPVTQTSYSSDHQANITDVLTPIFFQGQVVGVIRLTHKYAAVSARFSALRGLVAWIMAGGLVLGAIIGLVAAIDIDRPLERLKRAISRLPAEQADARITESGPQEIRLLAQTFNRLAERLSTSEAGRRHLLSNLVHELGRPLGALRSATQALLRGAEDDPALRTEFLQGIDGEAARLQRLLDDLTRLHDVVLDDLALAPRPLDLSRWLPRTLAPWIAHAQAKGLEWHADLSAQLPTLEVDADRLAQALGNVLSNAIKYTPPGGQVEFAIAAVRGGVEFRVTDSGIGVSASDQGQLFEPFFRGQANPRFAQGMGLGLHIAKTIVEAHGGRIGLHASPVRGTSFYIHLPQRGDAQDQRSNRPVDA